MPKCSSFFNQIYYSFLSFEKKKQISTQKTCFYKYTLVTKNTNPTQRDHTHACLLAVLLHSGV